MTWRSKSRFRLGGIMKGSIARLAQKGPGLSARRSPERKRWPAYVALLFISTLMIVFPNLDKGTSAASESMASWGRRPAPVQARRPGVVPDLIGQSSYLG